MCWDFHKKKRQDLLEFLLEVAVRENLRRIRDKWKEKRKERKKIKIIFYKASLFFFFLFLQSTIWLQMFSTRLCGEKKNEILREVDLRWIVGNFFFKLNLLLLLGDLSRWIFFSTSNWELWNDIMMQFVVIGNEFLMNFIFNEVNLSDIYVKLSMK